ncbi:DNA-directed RNA polymerase I subunit RPA12-like [Aristolochia californica]|uniref:DNA-directed RNA polymerase I subunit RPA12-like n=1 Tax=Aristolochia californica TaxID=171875 RepID=UPI0035E29605
MVDLHETAFMFCDICGSLLSMTSLTYAECLLCGLKRSIKELQEKETSYKITAEDIRRNLKIQPFVQLNKFQIAEAQVERATVNEACPQCRHPQLEYYTKQLRSADEGQTVFYECPKCRHKFSYNT